MTFPIRFLLCNILISLLLGCILLVKRGFKKHMTLCAQYYLWYIFVFALFLPFIPYRIFDPDHLLWQIKNLFSQLSSPIAADSANGAASTYAASNWNLEDFSTAAASSSNTLNSILCGIWICGMFLALLYFLYTGIKIYFLRKHALLVNEQTEPDLSGQFLFCCEELKIRRKIRLYASCCLSTPVSYGWVRPTVIIPQDLDIVLSEDELHYIFLHELQHYKHRDAFLNDLVCLMQIIYWFNPFLWFGFEQLRKDREIACDHAVIHIIGREKSGNYGYTILKYAEQMQKGMFLSPLSTLGGNHQTIHQRIVEIADYKKDSASKKRKSAGLMIFTLLLVIFTSPLLNASASPAASFQLDRENLEEIDVSSYFHGLQGSFVLYDMDHNQYQIYNHKLSEQRVSPDSTFKIYSGLFALEEQLISPESSLLAWDKSQQPFPQWERDQTLDTAMKNSVNWYFQELDKRSGLTALSAFYQKISYGNCDLTGGLDSYWAESSLKISPVEQVMLLSDMLHNQWDLKPENIEAIKDSLYLSETAYGKLYGKTGSGMADGKNVNGWFVGFLEKNGRTWCFATNIRDSEEADGSTAARITTDILNALL